MIEYMNLVKGLALYLLIVVPFLVIFLKTKKRD